MIRVTIYMEPVGKARPRVTIKKGRVMTYTPQKTAFAENLIRAEVMKLKEFYEAHVPLTVIATFFRTPPKHLAKGITKPVTRPDWDNYAKTLFDALEKFVYANDSQITTAVIKKRFGSPPRIELMIDEDRGL